MGEGTQERTGGRNEEEKEEKEKEDRDGEEGKEGIGDRKCEDDREKEGEGEG